MPQNCFNKGDGLDFSIAAASIVAKVYRDRLMDELAREHPEYGFERHKGYVHVHSRVARRILDLVLRLETAFDAAAAAVELEAIDQELGACSGALAENEQRKLRLVLSRRSRAL